MRGARIARPDAIYDASAAAQTFPERKTIEENEESGEISKIEEGNLTKAKKTILIIFMYLQKFYRASEWMLIR